MVSERSLSAWRWSMSRLSVILLMLVFISGCSASAERHPAVEQAQGLWATLARHVMGDAVALESTADDVVSLVVPEDRLHNLDLLVLAKTTPNHDFALQGPAPFRRDIDGNLVRNSEDGTGDRLTYCDRYLHDLPEAGGSDSSWLAVQSVYRANGVNNLQTAAFERLDDYFNPQGREIFLHHRCPSINMVELLIVPRYVHEAIVKPRYADSGAQFEVLAYLPFDALQAYSVAMDERSAEHSTRAVARGERYRALAETDDRRIVGSLFFAWNSRNKGFDADDRHRTRGGFYPQTVCALTMDDDEMFAIRGYRSLGNAMLSESLQVEQALWARQTRSDMRLQADQHLTIEQIHESLDAVYQKADSLLTTLARGNWPSRDACHVFVGFPQSIVRLQAALARRGHYRDTEQPDAALGQLFPVAELRERFATRTGYVSWQELDFVMNRPEGVTHEQLAVLRDGGHNTEAAYGQLLDEIRDAGYLDEVDVSVANAVQYLDDLDVARTLGISVLQAREQRRVEEQRRAELEAERRQAARSRLERDFPYHAVLSCELQGAHTTIAACFAGGRLAAATTLELVNGDDYRLYAVHELDRAGRERRDGLHIPLRNQFRIQAQNSSPDLLLTLTVYERATGKAVSRRSVQQYGVVAAQQ